MFFVPVRSLPWDCGKNAFRLAACSAADCSLKSAAHVSFQRLSPSLPPPQNVNSAALAEPAACHFGGFIAQIANVANKSLSVFAPLR